MKCPNCGFEFKGTDLEPDADLATDQIIYVEFRPFNHSLLGMDEDGRPRVDSYSRDNYEDAGADVWWCGKCSHEWPVKETHPNGVTWVTEGWES